MKATKTFKAVKPGEIYPVEVKVGDVVPKELEETAVALGAAKKTSK
jgi:hypothetical protein